MTEQEITAEKIDEIVGELPSFYIRELARASFGRASKANIRKIKYWRSGNMKDPIEAARIYRAAEKLKEKCQQAVAG